jgi:hypothetical protein
MGRIKDEHANEHADANNAYNGAKSAGCGEGVDACCAKSCNACESSFHNLFLQGRSWCEVCISKGHLAAQD